ncbi:hypothetical protein CKALI_02820 [Corynebacterium kalinowskii]|uniref:Uncharacterized protein n=1 Tax=Corynebacterium kalinowskii TaxID=2675216 RepID=A0A6B8VVW8_9CORY|nr:DUF6882 domain-containing protein [Corynebacterium kalinowskii]QGU01450.1 hypothetical protein CKALI_02820 [Corynebacterium kalinowskii]
MIPEIRRVGQHAVLVATAQQEIFGDFIESITGPEYEWAFDRGVLTFESDQGWLKCDTYPVASIAVEPATVLWRWQPMSEEEATYFRGDAVAGYRHQLRTFSQPEVPYESGQDQVATIAQVGHDIIAAGYEIFGLGSVFYQARFNAAGSRLVWALANFRTAGGPVEVPRPMLHDVLVKAPRLLDSADDFQWSLSGVAQFFTGVKCVMERFIPERRHVATFTEPNGTEHSVDVTLTEHGHVEYVKMSIGPLGDSKA